MERIEDRDGNLVYLAEKKEKNAMSYRSAYLMQTLLMAGLSGTSASLVNYVRPFCDDTEFGGKTGTSNNHADAWFVGVTPRLVGGAWVGGEYPSIHFRTGNLGQGSRTALPIFGEFIRCVLSDDRFSRYRTKFQIADGIDPGIWISTGRTCLRPDSVTASASGKGCQPAPGRETLPVSGEGQPQDPSGWKPRETPDTLSLGN